MARCRPAADPARAGGLPGDLPLLLEEVGGLSDGAHLLDELHAALTRYVVLPGPEAADAVVLWIAATHAQPAWEHAPRLAAVSPEKRCGKSRLMDAVDATCHRPLITVNATVAAVFRSIGDDPPTLLVDEADTIFGSKRQAEHNEDLRGLLNAGHQRNRPALRMVGAGAALTVGKFNTFAMAMLASIGELPDTIMDRAVIVRMRRRRPDERVAPFRTGRDTPPLHELRDRLAAWVREHLDELGETDPKMPVEDRAADTWAPLVAIADLAGADWPARARRAVVVGVQEAEEGDGEASLRLQLLADLKAIFKDAQALHTRTILDKLHELEESPWNDLFGKPLDPRGLSRRLHPYGIKPTDVRETGDGPNLKGYKREDLLDAWTRYLVRDMRDVGDMAGQRVADRGAVADRSATTTESATGTSSNVAAVAPVAEPLWELDPGDPARWTR
jgi:Protein of unknown function (DUF3631)